jgi:hypothetical protein
LKEQRIHQSKRLLDHAKGPSERRRLSDKTGIPEQELLKFANAADLMRIKGIGRDYVALLREADVITLRDLRTRNPVNLFTAMARVNALRRIVNFLPPENLVRRWVERANELPIVIGYK